VSIVYIAENRRFAVRTCSSDGTYDVVEVHPFVGEHHWTARGNRDLVAAARDLADGMDRIAEHGREDG
jgi:hypothetical protein